MKIALIAAMDNARGIGLGKDIPWFGKVPADMKRFRDLTMEHVVIMGRKTYDSMGRALPKRKNIVLSRSKELVLTDAKVYEKLHDALSECNDEGRERVFILGGGEIFAQALPLANELYLTHIESTFEADVFFPQWDPNEWMLCERTVVPQDERNLFSMVFEDYVR